MNYFDDIVHVCTLYAHICTLLYIIKLTVAIKEIDNKINQSLTLHFRVYVLTSSNLISLITNLSVTHILL